MHYARICAPAFSILIMRTSWRRAEIGAIGKRR